MRRVLGPAAADIVGEIEAFVTHDERPAGAGGDAGLPVIAPGT